MLDECTIILWGAITPVPDVLQVVDAGLFDERLGTTVRRPAAVMDTHPDWSNPTIRTTQAIAIVRGHDHPADAGR